MLRKPKMSVTIRFQAIVRRPHDAKLHSKRIIPVVTLVRCYSFLMEKQCLAETFLWMARRKFEHQLIYYLDGLSSRCENRMGMEITTFLNWARVLIQIVRDLTSASGKELLTYDAYQAHLSLEVLHLFRKSNIIAYALLECMSGNTQSCD